MEYASTAVAGPSKADMTCTPDSYVSRGTCSSTRTEMITATDTRSGLSNGDFTFLLSHTEAAKEPTDSVRLKATTKTL